jgi:hypothetical protein
VILKTIHGAGDRLRSLAVALDSRAVTTCGMSSKIYLWDTLTGGELLTLQGRKARINDGTFADHCSLSST